MSNTAFNANQRLAEIALWLDASASWADRATAQARAGRSGKTIVVTFERAELETFVSGLRGVARALMGLAQPVPPPLPEPPQTRSSHLRLVR